MTSKTDARIRAAYEPVGALGEPLDRLIAKWRASRAHTYASENADLYRGFDNGCQRCADDLEAALRAAGDARRPQLHQKAIDRLTALHRHMGNVRSLLDRVQATRTPDHDAQDRTVGDWQEQVTLAIGELTEAAGAPADGAGTTQRTGDEVI